MKKKVSTRGLLIKIHSEHQPRSNVKMALGTKKKGSGVYVLYSRRKVYYIGKSERSMRGRIKGHKNKKWDNFSFFQIRKKKYIKDIETLLLKVINPRGNRIKGRFKSRTRI